MRKGGIKIPSIAERKRRKKESAMLRQARLDLLAELDQLKDKVCEKCRKYSCDCPVAIRMREIGQELSVLINERTEIEVSTKEVKEVAKENKTPEITEAAVNAMRDKGMTYAAIAKEFGVSAPTITNRRQNWELERVRKQHQEGKPIVKSSRSEGVPDVDTAEISAVPSKVDALEGEIEELKEAVLRKNEIIQRQSQTITNMESELIKRDSIKGDRELLAILLEREAARIKNLLEVG